MRKSILLIITIVTLDMIVISCGPYSDKANDYAERISRFTLSNNVDSLKALRDELAQEDNEARMSVVDAVTDSAINIRGMALVVAFNVDDLANYLVKNACDSLLVAVRDSYEAISSDDDFIKLCNTMQNDLDKMDINTQASYLTTILTPEQIASGLQSKDSTLLSKIKIIYKSKPDLAARLGNAINQ